MATKKASPKNDGIDWKARAEYWKARCELAEESLDYVRLTSFVTSGYRFSHRKLYFEALDSIRDKACNHRLDVSRIDRFHPAREARLIETHCGFQGRWVSAFKDEPPLEGEVKQGATP